MTNNTNTQYSIVETGRIWCSVVDVWMNWLFTYVKRSEKKAFKVYYIYSLKINIQISLAAEIIGFTTIVSVLFVCSFGVAANRFIASSVYHCDTVCIGIILLLSIYAKLVSYGRVQCISCWCYYCCCCWVSFTSHPFTKQCQY